MKIYYDDDAQIEIIRNMKVSIIGYGSQGHAHANNLNDSGVDITVGLREGSASWKKAQDAGLKVQSVSDSVLEADMVMILAPDEFQKGIYENQIKPNLKPNAILGFAHGFNIHFKKIIPPVYHRQSPYSSRPNRWQIRVRVALVIRLNGTSHDTS